MAETDWKAISRGYDCILALLRQDRPAMDCYKQMKSQLSKIYPHKIWSKLDGIQITDDIAKVGPSLVGQLARPAARSGQELYFGLDTLNMEGGRGSNIEMALLDTGWGGRSKLLKGLYEMWRIYNPVDDEGLSQFIEMPLWVGYTGIVLIEALRADLSVAAGDAGTRTVVWGHHDGDLFTLAKFDGKGMRVVASK